MTIFLAVADGPGDPCRRGGQARQQRRIGQRQKAWPQKRLGVVEATDSAIEQNLTDERRDFKPGRQLGRRRLRRIDLPTLVTIHPCDPCVSDASVSRTWQSYCARQARSKEEALPITQIGHIARSPGCTSGASENGTHFENGKCTAGLSVLRRSFSPTISIPAGRAVRHGENQVVDAFPRLSAANGRGRRVSSGRSARPRGGK